MQQKSDNVVSHYVFEAPVRIWHWLTVLCMAVSMVTGYFIGKPLPSVSGEAQSSVRYGLHQVNSLQRRDGFYRGFADADHLGFCWRLILPRAVYRAGMA
ncbi:cytochrome b/b6 domain-containing protein [Escherichia coli]